jgi:hypothetical protein
LPIGIAGTGVLSTAVLAWTTKPYVIDMLLEVALV